MCVYVRERERERVHIEQFVQEAVLEVQQAEREDTVFSHRCLFCRDVFTGNRTLLFQHMLADHSFNVGQPDNLGMHVCCKLVILMCDSSSSLDPPNTCPSKTKFICHWRALKYQV